MVMKNEVTQNVNDFKSSTNLIRVGSTIHIHWPKYSSFSAMNDFYKALLIVIIF